MSNHIKKYKRWYHHYSSYDKKETATKISLDAEGACGDPFGDSLE